MRTTAEGIEMNRENDIGSGDTAIEVSVMDEVVCVDLFPEVLGPEVVLITDDVQMISDTEDELSVLSSHPIIPKGIFLDCWSRRASHYGLSAFTFQTMCLNKCPPVFFNTIYFLYQSGATSNHRDLKVIDMFAGRGYLYRSLAVDYATPGEHGLLRGE